MSTVQMLQILDEKGQAVADASDAGLSDKEIVRLYQVMLQTRALDERMLNLQRQGRIGFYLPSTGEEALQAGSAYALRRDDWIYPSYRVPGILLLRGAPMRQIVAQCYGNSGDRTLGRQMPVHYSFKDVNFVSISSPIGTQIAQAAGTGMAMRIRGTDEVVMTFFGDGGTSSNDFHAGLNIAAVSKAPVVFVCNNNGWAISVPLHKQTACEHIADKAEAYGMPGVIADGNDLLATYKVCKQAVDRARAGEGPTLVELKTYRRGPHSSSDDPTRYRGDEAKQWEGRDPILRLRSYLERKDLWSQAQEEAALERLKAEINEAIAWAETLDPPGLDTMFTDVYAQVPPHLREQYEDLIENEGTGHEPDPDAAFPL